MNSRKTLTLDEMCDAWQRESVRIDNVLADHPLEHGEIHYGAGHTFRPSRLMAAATAAVCLAALAWLAALAPRAVGDIIDLVPHVAVALLLLCTLADSLHAAFGDTHLGPVLTGWRSVPRLQQFAAVVAVTAILIIAATPSYEGRAATAYGIGARNATLATAHQILDGAALY